MQCDKVDLYPASVAFDEADAIKEESRQEKLKKVFTEIFLLGNEV
jgi:hypothetical protein